MTIRKPIILKKKLSDHKFKSLHIIFSFVGKEHDVVLVEKYDKKSLYPLLIKCHEHLPPLIRLNKHFVN
jgi:hypothetical protein